MDKELREKIAHTVFMVVANPPLRTSILVHGIKEAYPTADQILSLIKEAGYIRLADDQSLPALVVKDAEGSPDGLDEFARGQDYAQQDMLALVWRKVELEPE